MSAQEIADPADAPQALSEDLRSADEASASTELELRVSEIFDSVQGEGPTAGAACTFLRLAGCNLTCRWCDTPYTWDWSRFDRRREIQSVGVRELAERLRQSPRLVVTGGEPLLQERALLILLDALPRTLPVEVETNGTRAPSEALRERIDQWNVSPKLANSGEPGARRKIDAALLLLRDTGRAWLKFVVGNRADAEEARGWALQLSWPAERVQLMPLAANRAELMQVQPTVEALAQEFGLRLSPRLHVAQWDGRRGV